MKHDIWLISSKDIEKLAGKESSERLIHPGNSIEYDVFDERYNSPNKHLSLGIFYHDLYLNSLNRKTVIKNKTDYENGKIEISKHEFKETEILEHFRKLYVQTESSAYLSLKLWELCEKEERKRIFYTRCFPNKEKFTADFGNLNGNIYLGYYWLVAYIESVNLILMNQGINVNDCNFNFLLHDSDISKSDLIGCRKFKDIFSSINFFDITNSFFKTLRNNDKIKIYYFQHTNNSFFYKYVVSNSSFFNSFDNPSEKLHKYLDLQIKSDEFLGLVKTKGESV